MPLSRYYRKAILIPSGFLIGGYSLYAIVYVVFDLGKDYKSEWMTANDAVLYTIPIVVINSLFTSILSTSIFLNSYRQVKNNVLLNVLSWFLLPGIWIGYLLSKHLGYLRHTGNGLDGESFFVLTNTLPFLIALVLAFRQYKLDHRTSNQEQHFRQEAI